MSNPTSPLTYKTTQTGEEDLSEFSLHISTKLKKNIQQPNENVSQQYGPSRLSVHTFYIRSSFCTQTKKLLAGCYTSLNIQGYSCAADISLYSLTYTSSKRLGNPTLRPLHCRDDERTRKPRRTMKRNFRHTLFVTIQGPTPSDLLIQKMSTEELIITLLSDPFFKSSPNILKRGWCQPSASMTTD